MENQEFSSELTKIVCCLNQIIFLCQCSYPLMIRNCFADYSHFNIGLPDKSGYFLFEIAKYRLEDFNLNHLSQERCNQGIILTIIIYERMKMDVSKVPYSTTTTT